MNDADHSSAGELLCLLRPTLNKETALAFLSEAVDGGYEFALLDRGVETGATAFAGFRILSTSRGTVLFLEDLVVAPKDRRSGAGTVLLTWLRATARKEGCDRIELDTGLANEGAQEFYATQGMREIAVHLAAEVR